MGGAELAVQARAESTRRRILEAAARLFGERGYSETGLTDIVEGAGLSTGAFYYHFTSKEAVASAIIDDFDSKLAETVLAHIDLAAPRVADLIRSTYAVQAMLRWDPYIQVGQLLMQAFEQISPDSRRVTVDWTEKFVFIVAAAHQAGELREDADPFEVGEAIWIAVLGSHVLSVTLRDNPFARLARVWRFILGATVPTEALPAYDDLLAELVSEYAARAEPGPESGSDTDNGTEGDASTSSPGAEAGTPG